MPVGFCFNHTATTEIYTLSLHDALPISRLRTAWSTSRERSSGTAPLTWQAGSGSSVARSEEHTSELQSQSNLVCRLLLEKKNHTQADRAVAHHLPRRIEVPIRLDDVASL